MNTFNELLAKYGLMIFVATIWTFLEVVIYGCSNSSIVDMGVGVAFSLMLYEKITKGL